MPRILRITLSVLGITVLALVLLVAAAWFLMPRDWIDREAKARAGQMTGATIRWNRLEPGLTWLAIGVRIEGLYVRMPAEGKGDAELEARFNDIFVSFQLLPLLSRRVELSAASIRGAGIAMTERVVPPDTTVAMPPKQAAGVALLLPRLDLDGIDIRTRDIAGGGMDIRRLSGRVEVGGPVDHPQAIRITARAESLFWKASARDRSILLPSPLTLDAAAKGDGSGTKLVVERGSVNLGPLVSTLTGEARFAPAAGGASATGAAGAVAGGPELALDVTGAPQAIRSSDPAFRPLASAWPVSWSTTASWVVHITGPASAPIQSGLVTLKPISVTSGANTFSLARAVATWTTMPDKTFSSKVEAADQGLELALSVGGSMVPGGATSGTVNVHALASRLNGLIPGGPTWHSGTIACRAVFTSKPPTLPSVGWTATGEGLGADVQGLQRPISRMSFDVRGDERVVAIRSFDATVGSTSASLTGTVLPGTPLGTGTFRASLDKLVAEEWAPPPPPGGKAANRKSPPPVATPAAPPPIPLRSFDAMITIGELHSGTMTVRDVVVPVKYADGTLTAAPISGRIGTGSIAGGLTLRDLVSKPSYVLNMDVKRAPVEELITGLLPLQLPITGFASGAIDLAGPGIPGAEVSDSLRGALTGTVEDGKVMETPTISGLRSVLGLGSTGTTGGDLVFKTLTHSIRIDGGRLLLDKVKGDLGKDLFEMAGSMGFDKSLNLDLLLRLAPERLKGGTALATFARYARDKDGRLPLNVKVTGTAMAPKFSVKGGKTLDVAIGKLGEELARSLTESGRHDSTRVDSTAPVDALKKGREALKRLLGK